MSIELVFENAQLKGRVIALDAEVKCLEAVIRAHERVDCLSVTSLKKQLVEAEAENARLKAEVERLTEAWVDNTMQEDRDALLQQVERLTKAGNNLARYAINRDKDMEITEVEAWNAAKGVQS